MTSTSVNPSPMLPGDRAIRDLDLGVRLGVLAASAFPAGFTIWLTTRVSFGHLDLLLNNMLKGQTLPAMTRALVAGEAIWQPLTLALLAVAIVGGLKIKRPLVALLAIGACTLAQAIIALLICAGTWDAVGEVIKKLS